MSSNVKIIKFENSMSSFYKMQFHFDYISNYSSKKPITYFLDFKNLKQFTYQQFNILIGLIKLLNSKNIAFYLKNCNEKIKRVFNSIKLDKNPKKAVI